MAGSTPVLVSLHSGEPGFAFSNTMGLCWVPRFPVAQPETVAKAPVAASLARKSRRLDCGSGGMSIRVTQTLPWRHLHKPECETIGSANDLDLGGMHSVRVGSLGCILYELQLVQSVVNNVQSAASGVQLNVSWLA